MHKSLLFVTAAAFLLSGANALAGEESEFAGRVQNLLARAIPRMACNLSPQKEKPVVRKVNGRDETVLLKPAPGSLVAAPSFDNPDYYFHWNRDSALVVSTLLRFVSQVEGAPAADKIRVFLADFVRFSAQLQASETPYALGEVRFNVDGSVDEIPWSRPQHDGPALRVLALLDLLALGDGAASAETRALARQVIKADLDHLSYAFEAKSYDLWEYSFGHHFFTRLVQLSALERGAQEVPALARREWKTAATGLRRDLAHHWNEKDGIYHFSLGKVTNWEGNEVPEVGAGRDASTVLGALSAGYLEGAFSLSDPKILGTAWVVEDYFRRAYPLNEKHAYAPAIGRHPDDDYYGGNPWFVNTSAYGELYYRLSAELSGGEAPFLVIKENRAFFESALGRSLKLGTNLRQSDALREELSTALRAKGDGFLATMMEYVAEDGMMAEQFSKDDGRPISAVDLTWSYSAFLSAALARGGLDLRALDLTCAQP